jgi:hypothetical protein
MDIDDVAIITAYLIGVIFFNLGIAWFHITLDLSIRDRFIGTVRTIILLTKYIVEIPVVLAPLVLLLYGFGEYGTKVNDRELAFLFLPFFWFVTFLVANMYFFNRRKEDYKKHKMTIWG